MKTLFVTGSGTEIGKTYVTTALIGQLRAQNLTVRALKPVISDYRDDTAPTSDTALILEALGAAITPDAIEAVSPWRFAAPLSPDMAAAREGRALDFDAILEFCRAAARGPQDVLLIEGVGGVMVPLTGERTVLDWMAALGSPALLVVGSYLGTISHTLTAFEALHGRNIPIAGIAISESPDSSVPLDETRDTIARFAGAVPVVAVPRGAAPPDLIGFLDGT